MHNFIEIRLYSTKIMSLHNFYVATMTTKDSLHLKLPGLLSPRGQRGVEAKIFGFGLGLGLVASGLGLVLVLVITWPRCQLSKSHHLRYVLF